MKSYKMSYYIFYVLMALIILVLGLFFGVGYDNQVGGLTAPEHTETLMYFMYAMFAICVFVTVFGALAQFGASFKDDPKGAVKSLLALALFAGVIIVSYALASDAPLAMADGTMFTDVTLLKLSDLMIYSNYILLVVAIVVTLVNLTGIFKR